MAGFGERAEAAIIAIGPLDRLARQTALMSSMGGAVGVGHRVVFQAAAAAPLASGRNGRECVMAAQLIRSEFDLLQLPVVAAVWGAMIVPKATVRVVDRLDPALAPAVVANVPVGIALFASVTSQVGDGLRVSRRTDISAGAIRGGLQLPPSQFRSLRFVAQQCAGLSGGVGWPISNVAGTDNQFNRLSGALAFSYMIP